MLRLDQEVVRLLTGRLTEVVGRLRLGWMACATLLRSHPPLPRADLDEIAVEPADDAVVAVSLTSTTSAARAVGDLISER